MSNSSNSTNILDQKLWDEKIEIACEHLVNALEERIKRQAKSHTQYQSSSKFGSYTEPNRPKITVNFCRDIFCNEKKYPALEKHLSSSQYFVLTLSHDVFELFKQGVGLCAEKFQTLLMIKLNEKYSKDLGYVLRAGCGPSISEKEATGSVFVEVFIVFQEVADVPNEKQSSSKQQNNGRWWFF